MQVLAKITELLKKQGKKQKDLTDFLGLSGQAVTNWKNGNSNSYQKYLPRIAEFLGVSVDYLVGTTDTPDRDEELNEYLEQLRSRSEMKMLFNLIKDASEEEVKKSIQIIEILLKKD